MDTLDFVVPGAQRAGTTTLYSVLCDHPQICMINEKDSYYFSSTRDTYSVNKYKKLFLCEGNEKITGDVCANYYWNENVPRRINKMFGASVKVIFMVRDPLKRAFSSYHHRKKNNNELRSIEDVFLHNTGSKEELIRSEEQRIDQALESRDIRIGDLKEKCEFWKKPFLYLQNSFYSDFVEEFVQVFGTDQVFIFTLEDLENDPAGFFKKLWETLKVKEDVKSDKSRIAHHKSRPAKNLIATGLRRMANFVPSSIKRINALRRWYEYFQSQQEELPTKLRDQLREPYLEEKQALDDLCANPVTEHWDI